MQEQNTSVIVYIITNEYYRSEDGKPIIKIGFAGGSTISDLEKRLKQLYSTGVPSEFICNYAIVVKNRRVEKLLHDIFADYRINENREFFKISLKTVKSALLLSGAEFLINQDEDDEQTSVTEKGKVEQNKSTNIYTLEELGIPKGAELIYTRDSSKICYADEGRKVIYDGNRYSPSGLVKKFLEEEGTFKNTSVNGWMYLTHNGKTLYELWKERCPTC